MAKTWPGALALGMPLRMRSSAEPTVTELLARAEELARRRAEPLAGVHLLASLGAAAGPARDLLEEKGAGFRRVLDQWEELLDRGPQENLQMILRATQQTARRYGQRTATASHLLLALLGDAGGSVRRVFDAMGVDAAVLRSSAMQIAQGLPTRRRPVSSAAEGSYGNLGRRPPRGVAVPVMPTEPVRGRATGRPRPAGRGKGEAVPLVSTTPVSHRAADVRVPPQNALGASASLEAPREEAESAAVQGGGCSAEIRAAAGKGPPDGPFSLDSKKFPILAQVGRNLTLLAAQGKLDQVVGREEEIEHALDVLAKRHGNNPCLIGPAGVGKTSVARGIAARLAELERSEAQEGEQIVVEIPISELLAGTGVRGALAGRLAALKKEVEAAAGRVVLFFDEIHQLFSGDAAEEIAGDLKLSLARGQLPCIGATSPEEFRRVIEADPALSRRFSAVEVEEPSREDAFLVLSGVAERLAGHHRVRYDEEALALAISWSVRYLPGRALPDKAVAVIDLAGARARRRGVDRVDPEAVADVVANQATMPVERLLQSDADRMLGLEEMLRERVIGHEQHLAKIARILRRNAAGLGSRRPIGTFLLLGPTGVGKTETAKAIAEVLFHSEAAMTRIDMAEMSEAHAVARLIGAPPGYIGHDAGGQLTEAVRRRPYQVVLLDEIEKAHPEVLTTFLAVFDEGRMTDSRGRLVDFTNTVILLTSNLGSSAFLESRKKRVGFRANQDGQRHDAVEPMKNAARDALPPELYNRIDEILTFAPLSRSAVLKIGRKLVKGLSDELEISRGALLEVDDAAIEVLLDQGGYDPEFGARPLRRTLARLVEAPLAEALLSGQLAPGDTWQVTGSGGELHSTVLRKNRLPDDENSSLDAGGPCHCPAGGSSSAFR